MKVYWVKKLKCAPGGRIIAHFKNKFKSTSTSTSLHILLLCSDSFPHAIHKFLKLLSMACALPNVTSRVLVVGLRLGMAEQHIFRCGVFLYPGTTGKTWRRTEVAFFACCGFPRISAQRGLQLNLIACLLYRPADVIRTPISIPWMTFEMRSARAPLPLPVSSWVDALMSSLTWPVVDTANSMALKLDFKLT